MGDGAKISDKEFKDKEDMHDYDKAYQEIKHWLSEFSSMEFKNKRTYMDIAMQREESKEEARDLYSELFSLVVKYQITEAKALQGNLVAIEAFYEFLSDKSLGIDDRTY